jgi:cyclopropane-fatty-acyl-phospholipid synthase
MRQASGCYAATRVLHLMATVAVIPVNERTTAPAVRTCYDLMCVAPACGITDFTDGKYVDDRSPRRHRASYLAAQERQAEYLLDMARCSAGTRLLDIGCGYGRILEHAERRGARATGITVSLPQVKEDRARGLDVHLCDYRQLLTNPAVKSSGSGDDGLFDAIIANGSLEHFVQVDDAAAGRDDAIYREMFAICRKLLADGGRLVTTAIHFSRTQQFDPVEIMKGPDAHSPRSPKFQYAMLVDCFGGWYPEPGQLERCARGNFRLIEEEDGTHDYYLTSEYWFRRFAGSLVYDPRVWWATVRQFWQHPRAAWRFLRLQIWDQSWAWQFRPPAPMRLLRQTWEGVD